MASHNSNGSGRDSEIGTSLTREDVRGEVRSALEQFAVEALQKEISKLEVRLKSILQKSAEVTIQCEAQELRLGLRQELRSALDEWWGSAPRVCVGTGNVSNEIPGTSKSAQGFVSVRAAKAKAPAPLQGLWSSVAGSSWPPQNLKFSSRSRANTIESMSPSSSPLNSSPTTRAEVEQALSSIYQTPSPHFGSENSVLPAFGMPQELVVSRDSQTPSSSPPLNPKSPPSPQASPGSKSTPGSPNSSFPVKDWRKSFVQKATKANRKIEYLHGTQCREAHQVNDVLESAAKALEDGIRPTLVEDGVGGTYFMKDSEGRSIAVFKPRDEEAYGPNNPKDRTGEGQGEGLKEGVLVGEVAINEYVAFLLDQMSSPVLRAGVCPTALVCVAHSVFHSAEESRQSVFRSVKDKVGSFQLFADHKCTSEDMGSSRFPVDQTHAIAALDIRLCNTDRHSGNVLVRDNLDSGDQWQLDLVPIDHGYCLPAAGLSAEFEWMTWPAAKQPFSEAMRKEILAIDIDAAAAKLQQRIPSLRPECIYTLNTCTLLLKHGVENGLTAYDIGLLMTRPEPHEDEPGQPLRPSALEELVAEARRKASERDKPEQHRTILEAQVKRRCREASKEKSGRGMELEACAK